LKLGYVFLAAFVTSLGIVTFGEAGLLTAYQVSQENARYEQRIQQLQGENSRLLHDIEWIQKNPRKLEYTIRTILSLVAQDEILFEFQ
jgi:cell division protein FtsB